MTLINVGFTGTRNDLTDKQITDLHDGLKTFKQFNNLQEFHHGDCIGADFIAGELAKDLGYKVVIHPPEDSKNRAFADGDIILPTRPYLDRNKDIVNASHVVIACPDCPVEKLRSGTWSTIRYAKKMGMKCIIINP